MTAIISSINALCVILIFYTHINTWGDTIHAGARFPNRMESCSCVCSKYGETDWTWPSLHLIYIRSRKAILLLVINIKINPSILPTKTHRRYLLGSQFRCVCMYHESRSILTWQHLTLFGYSRHLSKSLNQQVNNVGEWK